MNQLQTQKLGEILGLGLGLGSPLSPFVWVQVKSAPPKKAGDGSIRENHGIPTILEIQKREKKWPQNNQLFRARNDSRNFN